MSYSPWDRKESDMTKQLHFHKHREHAWLVLASRKLESHMWQVIQPLYAQVVPYVKQRTPSQISSENLMTEYVKELEHSLVQNKPLSFSLLHCCSQVSPGKPGVPNQIPSLPRLQLSGWLVGLSLKNGIKAPYLPESSFPFNLLSCRSPPTLHLQVHLSMASFLSLPSVSLLCQPEAHACLFTFWMAPPLGKTPLSNHSCLILFVS